jgi:fructokinase
MITVIGEAPVDLVPTSDDDTVLRAWPGAGPLRVAAAAARLGYPTALMARLSRDQFGQVLRRHAARSGADLSAAPEADEPTTVATAQPGAGPGPGRRLYYAGTADWQWSAAELACLPAHTTILHLGSLTCCVAPGAGRVLRRAARQRSRGALVCAGLRVHQDVMRTPGRGRVLAEPLIRAADVIRVSAEDLGWLYPGRALEDAARQWLSLGPRLVVITCAAGGALSVRGNGAVLHRPACPARVADTTGAGDAFTAALLGRLYLLRQAGRSVDALAGRELADLLDWAAFVAAVACERPGPDAPTAVEVRQALRARSGAGDHALAR